MLNMSFGPFRNGNGEPMSQNNHVVRSIGWAVIDGEKLAHYFKETPLGLVALSMCGQTAQPKLLRPATNQPRCGACSIRQEADASKQLELATIRVRH